MNLKKVIMVGIAAMVVMCVWADTWTDTATGYTWTYTVNGDTANIYKSSKTAAVSPKPTGALTIPSQLGGKTVTSIGSYAFRYCSGLTSVTIPDGVTNIGSNAFYNCSGLTSVTIGNGVTSIGASAFYGCNGLTAVYITDLAKWCGISYAIKESNPLYYAHDLYLNGSLVTDLKIPDSVTSIGSYAFYGCSGLASVTVPDSVTSIGGSAFSGCSGLASVTIGDSVTSIGGSAFSGCSGLASVTIPDSVTSIGSSAFSGCSGLTSVTIGNSVTSIGSYVFNNCTNLASVTIGDSVTSIGGSAFYGCSGLTSVTIPDSVTSIEASAFLYCSGLTSVTIPDSVTSIGASAFRGCSGLEEITLPFVGSRRGNAESSDSLFGYIFGTSSYIGGTKTEQYYTSFYSSSYYIPSKLKKVVVTAETVLGYGAFYNCSGLTSVTIPDSVTRIGKKAFYGCNEALFDMTSIPGVKLVDGWVVDYNSTLSGALELTGVRGIGIAAFSGCSGLTSVTIGNSVTSIGSSAFSGCSGLTSVTMGNSVTSIGGSAFYGCSGLTAVYITDLAKWCGISFASANANPLYYAHDLYLNGSLVTDLKIPDSVTSIGSYAFSGCSGLASVTVPDSVTSIGGSAFSGCSGLEKITLPFVGSRRGNTGSSDSLFGYIFGTSSYTGGTETKQYYTSSSCSTNYIPSKLRRVVVTDESIFCGAFDSCSGLTSVTIGDGATSIGEGAFSGCSGLTSVTIPDGVTDIGSNAFSGCSGLKAVTVPQCVCSSKMSSVFPSAYQSITNVAVCDGVTNMGASAFSGCSGLTSVTIPDSVTRIGEKAFYGCNEALFDVTSIPGVKQVDGWAVGYNSTFSGVLVLTGVRGIGIAAFSGCSNLTSVTIGNGVTSIGDYAFRNCTNLMSVTIPDSVTSIGGGAFYGCSGLKSFVVANGNANYSSTNGLLLSKDGKRLISGVNGNIKIPGSVTNIAAGAFSGRSGLTSVTIPDSVTSIGSSAFSGCSGLTSVMIPDSVTSIGSSAFFGCSNVTSVTIPNSVTNIGYSAFSRCSGLTSVTIGNGVTSIGGEAFHGCSGLTNVTIGNGVTSIGTAAFNGCNAALFDMTSVPGVKLVDGWAIDGRITLSGVLDLTGVRGIGNYAFSDCSGLTSVTIPDGVTSIGSSAFSGCSGLTSVTIPDTVEKIGANAFRYCRGLKSVSLPNSLKGKLDSSVFEGCSANITYRGPLPSYSVTFNANGGMLGLASSVRSVTEGTRVGELPEPTRTGYVFTGWWTAASGGTRISASTAVTGDVTYYAHWTVDTYTVTFNANGGTVGTTSVSRNYDQTVGTLPTPTRTECVFGGWWTSASGGTQIYSSTKVTSNVTYYAHWTINQYTVTFDANGGTGGTTKTQDYGTAIIAPTVTREGYTFAGWDPTSPSTVQASNATYTAQWTANKYTVAFNANGGTGEMAALTMTYDQEVQLTAGRFTKPDLLFHGWAVVADGELVYRDCACVSNLTAVADDVVTLYAVWQEKPVSVLTCEDAFGGAGVVTLDANDNIVVTLTNDVSGTVEIPDNVGSVTIDLNGHDMIGNGGLGETALPDGPAIRIVQGEGEGETTQLAIEDTSDGEKGQIAGGGESAGIEIAEDAAHGVRLDVDEAVPVLNGDGTEQDCSLLGWGPPPWPTDGAYNPLVANVYDGYIVDDDGVLTGIIQVKAAKQAVKTVTDKTTKEKTATTNVAVTATVTDAAGKKWSYKGDGTVDGVVTGLVCTTKGALVPSFGVTLGANGLSGEWGDLAVEGARNGMGTKGDAMMAELDASYKKSWSVTLTNEIGATRLQLVVGAKGSTKISGVTPDGFKVSATVQGIMGEDAFFVPYLATLKNGKLTRPANLLLTLGKDGAVVARTSDLGGLKAAGPTTDEIEVQTYSDSESSKGGEAYAGAVVLNELAYPAKFAAKGLPAGLKIDAATGAITGVPTNPGRYTATITVTSGVNGKKKVETKVDFVIGNYTDESIGVEDSYSGYCVGVMASEPIAGAMDCAVSGLPAGLKFATKETKDNTFGMVAAGTVYGVPTKAGEYTVYFKKTEKVNGKSVTRQASATFKVEALPEWAQGTFDGNVECKMENGELEEMCGTVTLTVDAKGKISGKLIDADGTWTLSAAAYERVEGLEVGDLDDLVFYATVIGKNGKKAITNEVTVALDEAARPESAPYQRGVVTGGPQSSAAAAAAEPPVEWTAWQNLWKQDPWKTDAKEYAKAPKLTVGEIELKFGASGAVTAGGKFVTGTDKNGKNVVYSASCSAVLVPDAARSGSAPYQDGTDETGETFSIYLYFPPKEGKFDGYAAEILLVWENGAFLLTN